MRKILHVISSLVILAAGVSCNKEMPGRAGDDGNIEVGAEMRTVSFKLNIADPTQTKAVSIAGLDENTINRIDVYEFDCSDYYSWQRRPNHFVLTEEELTAGVFHVNNPTNAKKGYLFYANLPNSIAEKIAGTEGSVLPTLHICVEDWYSGTGGIPMGGEKYILFDNDQTADVFLERFFYRIDVVEISADFENSTWMSKDVFVKNIALINVAAFTEPIGIKSTSSFTSYAIGNYIFGEQESAQEGKPFFGGLERVNYGFSLSPDYIHNCWNPNTDSSVGVWPLMNNNYKKSVGVLDISAEGVWQSHTLQSYDTGAGGGRICSSTDPSQPHTLSVNKSFYAMKGSAYNGQYGIVSSYNSQNAFPKLVIELSVDGKTYFYPIQIYRPQHNTAYRISRITLKSEGSEYSNFFEFKPKAEMSVSVANWNEKGISNIDLGYGYE